MMEEERCVERIGHWNRVCRERTGFWAPKYSLKFKLVWILGWVKLVWIFVPDVKPYLLIYLMCYLVIGRPFNSFYTLWKI